VAVAGANAISLGSAVIVFRSSGWPRVAGLSVVNSIVAFGRRGDWPVLPGVRL
jgi:hypothetical protein